MDNSMLDPIDPISSCHRCLGELYDYGEVAIVDGYDVCLDCCGACAECGEWLDDERCESFGSRVNVRDCTTGRCKMKHAECAADSLLQKISGDRFFYTCERSREEIAGLLESKA